MWTGGEGGPARFRPRYRTSQGTEVSGRGKDCVPLGIFSELDNSTWVTVVYDSRVVRFTTPGYLDNSCVLTLRSRPRLYLTPSLYVFVFVG